MSNELFDNVQGQLQRDNIQRTAHEFAFTKLMTCGACGSCISAKEKYKPRKDGTVARYVYYGCGRTRDKNCKGNTYLREEELVNQLLGIMDQIDFNELGAQVKFEEELKRYNRFQKTVLGLSDPAAKHTDVDNEEKRELMGCLKSKLKITKGVIMIGTV